MIRVVANVGEMEAALGNGGGGGGDVGTHGSNVGSDGLDACDGRGGCDGGGDAGDEVESVMSGDDFHGVTEVVRSSGVHADSRDGDDEDSVVQEVILDCWWFLCSW